MHEGSPPTDSPSTSLDAGAQIHIRQPLGPPSDRSRSANDDGPPTEERPNRQPQNERDAEPASYFRIKSAVDRSITAVLMLCALPLMLIVALAILVCDGRPVFFRQIRVGKNGRLFRIWKFRTMQRNAEQRTGAIWSSVTDPRVTRLGRWLRCSHLDELPQFLNVLGGDMNLVGPRPERPEIVPQLANKLPDYLKRTQVRPGITGQAQLRLGYDQSVADIPRKVACDLQYIRTAGFLQDVALLASTLPHIARKRYHRWSSDRRRPALDIATPQQDQASSLGDLTHHSGGPSPSSPKAGRYGTVSSHEDRVA